MKRIGRILGGVVMGLIALGLIGTMAPKPEATAEAPAPVAAPIAEAAKADLELLDDKGERSEMATTIVGRIRNNSGKRYSYAQVTFNLYNSAGEQVGTALANVNGLDPGGVWRFKAVGFTGDGENYKLDKITGY